LIDLLRANGIEFPDDLSDVHGLTPFAAELRYDELPPEPEEPFDRAWVMDRVRRTRAWAEAALSNMPPD